MKKVIYVFCSQNFGGAEIVIRRLICFNRDKVFPVVFCPPGLFSDELKRNNIQVVETKSLGSLERARRSFSKLFLPFLVLKKICLINVSLLKELFKEPLAVHTNNLPATIYVLPAMFLARWFIRKDIQWIWSSHDMSYPDDLSWKLAGYCLRQFHKTLVVSEAVKRLYPGGQSRITVLYNGIDTDLFRDDAESRNEFRRKFELRETSTVVAIVGKISRGKGHLVLLEAFQKLLKSFSEAYLMIIGSFSTVEPDFENEIRLKIKEIGENRLIVVSPLEKIQQAYNGIDILVNCTSINLGESLGTTIYEAMSCKKLVVATNTGGTPEIIDDGVDGFLVSPDDSSDLAAKLSFVIENLPRLGEVREAARRKVIEKFNIQKMAENYNRILGISE